MELNKEEILHYEKNYRANLINSVSGFKSANLIGTVSSKGNTNLAIFSSVIHVGANPPLIGLLMRPVSVPRHTYLNIKETNQFTINHVNSSIYKNAHLTSARFNEEESEFTKCGLTEEYLNDFKAPFVKESKIKMSVKFIEENEIKANSTILIIGEIQSIYLPDNIIEDDGSLNIEKADTAAISGLYSYHKTTLIEKLAYAKAF